MTEREVEKLGFYYTGASITKYASKREIEIWEEDKKIAREIKKLYKGADYKIATGTADSWLGSGNKGIYGNKIFNMVRDEYKYKTIQNSVNSYEENKQRLIDNFNAKLAELEEINKKNIEKLNYINSLKKEGE